MTNTPDKSEMKATERVANWLATPEGEVEEAPVDAIRELLGLVRSRPPADQVPDMVERDNCQICRGANGGVPGNENVICGVVVCDYCDAATRPFQASSQARSDDVVERFALAIRCELGPTARGMTSEEIERLNKAATAAIAALQAVPAASEVGWQPIESAPKDGTRILIAGGTRQHPDSMGGPEPITQPYIAHWNTLWKQWEGNPTSHDDCYSHEPTHWRPLPEPPAPMTQGEEKGR